MNIENGACGEMMMMIMVRKYFILFFEDKKKSDGINNFPVRDLLRDGQEGKKIKPDQVSLFLV